ncbi:hypothetical protein NMG60_11035419 [Bertholletia excelsa]
MASNLVQTSSKTCLALLLAMFMPSFLAHGQSKETTSMSFYFHNLLGGPNATIAPITGIPGRVWSLASFGTIYGVDNPVTEGLEGKSAAVGRAQGITANAALDGSTSYVLLSIVFTNNEYNGSTIELQGVGRQVDAVREVAVVGGSGKFRYSKGYATFETAYFDVPTGSVVTRCNVTLLVN